MYLGARFVFNSEFSFQNNPKLVIPMLVMFVCLFFFSTHVLLAYNVLDCSVYLSSGSRIQRINGLSPSVV